MRLVTQRRCLRCAGECNPRPIREHLRDGDKRKAANLICNQIRRERYPLSPRCALHDAPVVHGQHELAGIEHGCGSIPRTGSTIGTSTIGSAGVFEAQG
jgi:hypothetical protein